MSVVKKKLILVLISFLFFQLCSIDAQQKHVFEIKGGQFIYDGKPVQIHSGEMHYARVPKEYWQYRLRMLKAMGLNTVATYVFWNYHNTQPGVWDFNSDNRNLSAFLQMAKQEGLFVILRPGPYACAEWEFGGYPWWLQKDTSLVIRTYNKPFLDSCKIYINKLAEQVKPFLASNGGPVIMVQAENEFGSYVAQRKDISLTQHKKYNLAIKQLLTDAGINVPLFTSDGSWLFDWGSMEGVLPAANGETNIDNLKKVVNKYHNGEGPYMVAEYYPGWLHHWGEPFPYISTEDVVKQIEKYLQNGINFNIYMAHGGTNFGFTSGANYDDEHDIQPDLTTYDYDAPINEAGWATPKYMAIRELMKKYVSYPVPDIPAPFPVITLPAIQLKESVDVLGLVKEKEPITADSPMSFEALNQGNGYVLYRRKFNQPIQGKLNIKGLRDYAVVYINGKKKGILNRINKEYQLDVDIAFNGTLEILTENMGRINYGAEIVHNNKGIISPVFINDVEITGNWQMYSLPFSSAPVWDAGADVSKSGRPALYFGKFDVQNEGDVFLDMKNWGKGIVFINGHNLGRYWNIGPQQTLFLPGCWLKKGKNEIVVFEQLNENIQPSISTVAKPILHELRVNN